MAVTTAITTLNYTDTCPAQVETATVVGTISTAGNATVIVTAKDLVGSPVTFNVAVALSDTASQVATKIRTALQANADLVKLYTVNGSTADVRLTRIVPTDNDSSLNISVANGTCAGLTNALTSANTTAGGTFAKLCDITNYPDMGSAPSKLDSTTMSDTTYKTNIFGLQEVPDLTFEANYDEATYGLINSLSASKYFVQLVFGTADGKFDWQGQIKCYANGAGVDEVRKMTIVISAITPITFNILN